MLGGVAYLYSQRKVITIQPNDTMKRTLVMSLVLFFASLAARAMSYDEARQQAWFLTDKMAYELNLTPEQYDRAYEINLDYLMSLYTPADCTGAAWYYRDADFRCVLYDWQYNLFRTLDYFFRPVVWQRSRWYYPITVRYRYGYYYYDCPHIYVSYRGGRWRDRRPGAPSPYLGLRPHRGTGMRDHFPGNDRPRRPDVNFGGGRPGDWRPDGRPGNNDRPGSTRPGNGNRPGGNDRPGNGNGNRPGGNDRPGNGNRPGSGTTVTRPGWAGGHSSTGTTRPGNNGNVSTGTPRPGNGTTVTRPGWSGGRNTGNGSTTSRPTRTQSTPRSTSNGGVIGGPGSQRTSTPVQRPSRTTTTSRPSGNMGRSTSTPASRPSRNAGTSTNRSSSRGSFGR